MWDAVTAWSANRASRQRLAGGKLAEPSQRCGVATRDRVPVRGVSTARVRHALEPLRPEPRDGHAEAVKRRLAGGMLAEPSQRRGVAMRDRLLVRGVSSARVRRAPGLQRPETRLGHAAAGVQAEH